MAYGTTTFAGLLLAAIAFIPSAHSKLHVLGNGLVYDDVLQIEWLQDANLAATNGFGASTTIHTIGAMEVGSAFSFISRMNRANYLGFNDWRLPKIGPLDGVSFHHCPYPAGNFGECDIGNFISAPGTKYAGSTASELAYMFYNNLSNRASLPGETTLCGMPQGGTCLQNKGPFLNLGQYYRNYYSSALFESYESVVFDFHSGYQYFMSPGNYASVWPVRDVTSSIITSGRVIDCINDRTQSGCITGTGDINRPSTSVTLGVGSHVSSSIPMLNVYGNSKLTIDKLEAYEGTVRITAGGTVAAKSAHWPLQGLKSVTLSGAGKLLVDGEVLSKNNVITLSGSSVLEAGRIEIADANFGLFPGLTASEYSHVTARSALLISNENVVFTDGAKLTVGSGGLHIVASLRDSLLAFVPGSSALINGNQFSPPSAAPVQIAGPIVVEGNLVDGRKSKLVVEGTTLSASSLSVGPGGILTGADSVINTPGGTSIGGVFDPSGTTSGAGARLGQVVVNGPFHLARNGEMILELVRPGLHDQVFVTSGSVSLDGKVKIAVLPSDSFSNRVSDRMTLFSSPGGSVGKTLSFDYDTSGLEPDLSLGLRVDKNNGGLYINASIFRLEPDDLERDIGAMKASAREVAQSSGKMASQLEIAELIRGSIKFNAATNTVVLDRKQLAKEIAKKLLIDPTVKEIADTWGVANEYKIFDNGKSIFDSAKDLVESTSAIPNASSSLIGFQLKLGALAFGRLEKLSQLMANDPPDPLYRQVILAGADSFKFPDYLISGAANESFSRWITQYALAEKLLAGALASIERFQGATSAGDITSAILQGAAFDDYLAGYNSAMASLAALDIEIASSIDVTAADDFQIKESALMAIRSELANANARMEILEELVAGGLSMDEANAALNAIAEELASSWHGPSNYADILRLQGEIYRSQITAVPEPSTYALMLAGLCIVNFAARRCKHA